MNSILSTTYSFLHRLKASRVIKMLLHLQDMGIGTNLCKASVNLSAKQFHILGTSVESKSTAQSKKLNCNQSHLPEKSVRLKL